MNQAAQTIRRLESAIRVMEDARITLVPDRERLASVDGAIETLGMLQEHLRKQIFALKRALTE